MGTPRKQPKPLPERKKTKPKTEMVSRETEAKKSEEKKSDTSLLTPPSAPLSTPRKSVLKTPGSTKPKPEYGVRFSGDRLITLTLLTQEYFIPSAEELVRIRDIQNLSQIGQLSRIFNEEKTREQKGKEAGIVLRPAFIKEIEDLFEKHKAVIAAFNEVQDQELVLTQISNNDNRSLFDRNGKLQSWTSEFLSPAASEFFSDFFHLMIHIIYVPGKSGTFSPWLFDHIGKDDFEKIINRVGADAVGRQLLGGVCVMVGFALSGKKFLEDHPDWKGFIPIVMMLFNKHTALNGLFGSEYTIFQKNFLKNSDYNKSQTIQSFFDVVHHINDEMRLNPCIDAAKFIPLLKLANAVSQLPQDSNIYKAALAIFQERAHQFNINVQDIDTDKLNEDISNIAAFLNHWNDLKNQLNNFPEYNDYYRAVSAYLNKKEIVEKLNAINRGEAVDFRKDKIIQSIESTKELLYELNKFYERIEEIEKDHLLKKKEEDYLRPRYILSAMRDIYAGSVKEAQRCLSARDKNEKEKLLKSFLEKLSALEQVRDLDKPAAYQAFLVDFEALKNQRGFSPEFLASINRFSHQMVSQYVLPLSPDVKKVMENLNAAIDGLPKNTEVRQAAEAYLHRCLKGADEAFKETPPDAVQLNEIAARLHQGKDYITAMVDILTQLNALRAALDERPLESGEKVYSEIAKELKVLFDTEVVSENREKLVKVVEALKNAAYQARLAIKQDKTIGEDRLPIKNVTGAIKKVSQCFDDEAYPLAQALRELRTEAEKPAEFGFAEFEQHYFTFDRKHYFTPNPKDDTRALKFDVVIDDTAYIGELGRLFNHVIPGQAVKKLVDDFCSSYDASRDSGFDITLIAGQRKGVDCESVFDDEGSLHSRIPFGTVPKMERKKITEFLKQFFRFSSQLVHDEQGRFRPWLDEFLGDYKGNQKEKETRRLARVIEKYPIELVRQQMLQTVRMGIIYQFGGLEGEKIWSRGLPNLVGLLKDQLIEQHTSAQWAFQRTALVFSRLMKENSEYKKSEPLKIFLKRINKHKEILLADPCVDSGKYIPLLYLIEQIDRLDKSSKLYEENVELLNVKVKQFNALKQGYAAFNQDVISIVKMISNLSNLKSEINQAGKTDPTGIRAKIKEVLQKSDEIMISALHGPDPQGKQKEILKQLFSKLQYAAENPQDAEQCHALYEMIEKYKKQNLFGKAFVKALDDLSREMVVHSIFPAFCKDSDEYCRKTTLHMFAILKEMSPLDQNERAWANRRAVERYGLIKEVKENKAKVDLTKILDLWGSYRKGKEIFNNLRELEKEIIEHFPERQDEFSKKIYAAFDKRVKAMEKDSPNLQEARKLDELVLYIRGRVPVLANLKKMILENSDIQGEAYLHAQLDQLDSGQVIATLPQTTKALIELNELKKAIGNKDDLVSKAAKEVYEAGLEKMKEYLSHPELDPQGSSQAVLSTAFGRATLAVQGTTPNILPLLADSMKAVSDKPNIGRRFWGALGVLAGVILMGLGIGFAVATHGVGMVPAAWAVGIGASLIATSGTMLIGGGYLTYQTLEKGKLARSLGKLHTEVRTKQQQPSESGPAPEVKRRLI